MENNELKLNLRHSSLNYAIEVSKNFMVNGTTTPTDNDFFILAERFYEYLAESQKEVKFSDGGSE